MSELTMSINLGGFDDDEEADVEMIADALAELMADYGPDLVADVMARHLVAYDNAVPRLH